MSVGVYGNVRCFDGSPEDMEIFYTYAEDNSVSPPVVEFLEPTTVIEKFDNPNYSGEILGGMYNLKLPTSIFNRKGIYNIMIRPKRIRLRILDCGVLASNTDIRGIIFDLSSVPDEDVSRFENNGLIGYRVEYIDPNPNTNERKIQNLIRIITSNNRAEGVSENLNTTTQKGIRYIYNDNSTLVFCTVTPSSAPSLKPNVLPFIGNANQEVYLIPTYFKPEMYTIKVVEHDAETLAIGLFGDQTKSINDGIRTYYNEDGEIYKQFREYTVKDDENVDTLFDVKEEQDNIDFDKDLDNIII